MKKHTLFPILFGLILLWGCASDSGGGKESPPDESVTYSGVSAFYSSNGSNWNDYVSVDGSNEFTATGAACSPGAGYRYLSCLHGGEVRKITVDGATACSGYSANDQLGAFDWECLVIDGKVTIVSTGLKLNKNLSDLIDFSAISWKQNAVTINGPSGSTHTTVLSTWWSNPIVENNTAAAMDTTGDIYVLTDDSTPFTVPYSIGVDRVALVLKPGEKLVRSTSCGGTCGAIEVQNKNFVWIEGEFNNLNSSLAILLENVHHSVIRNVTAINTVISGSYGGFITLTDSENNFLKGLKSSGMKTSNSSNLLVNNSSFNTFLELNLANGVEGIKLISNSDGNIFADMVLASIENSGVSILASANNRFNGLTIANTGSSGVNFNGSSGVKDIVFANATSTNNTQRGYLFDSTSSGHHVVINASAVNNSNYGFYFNRFSNSTVSNVSAAHDYVGYGGILTGLNSDNNYFTGLLKMNGCENASDNTNDGFDSGCNSKGTSDFSLTTGIDLSDSFVARKNTDSTNTSTGANAGVSKYYQNVDNTNIDDWLTFDNNFRGWGYTSNYSYPSSSLVNYCDSDTTCRIWDWSLTKNDTGVIRAAVSNIPTGNDILTHPWSVTTEADCNKISGARWGANVCGYPGHTSQSSCEDASGDWTSNKCYSVFLRNATEIMGDKKGNENVLCESNERCLFTPNIASYQGHGNLVSAGTFTNGT
ncbi:right-handed parallel beta-helix repeat-containing protein, partial [bacterium]|nr:right-handed parallel beta-helix repeat-containing protein [bacterium]